MKDQPSSPPPDSKFLDYALDIVSLSKRFRRHTLISGSSRSGYGTIKGSLLKGIFGQKAALQPPASVIQDLTLRIPKGASVGIIGRNGAGKSTLLKLITGIYKPDTGTIRVNGRIAALIELGAGFHPDFTGRENIYLGGVMHGLTRDEITERFDDIIRFAELEAVIDDPIRTYSSGMFMRLGFSLAIHTDPDILIIDEVLAVGDASFVAKCKERISQLKKNGKTLFLVTHDLDSVLRWCDEALWLEKGEVRDRGNPRRVIDHYREFIERGEEEELSQHMGSSSSATSETSSDQEEIQRWGSREIELHDFELRDLSGVERHVYHPGDSFRLSFSYTVHQFPPASVFGIAIRRSDGVLIYGSNTKIEDINIPPLHSTGRVSFDISRIPLLDGTFLIDVAVHAPDGYPFDYHQGVQTFVVRNSMDQVGIFVPEHEWIFEKEIS